VKIGELAARAGCDVQTVRFYEREGLVEAPARDLSGYRRYEDRHLAQLNFVRHCRSLDIPLAEIRQLMHFVADPQASCHQVDALLDAHIALVRTRIRALAALEEQLVGLRRTCAGDGSQPCAILGSFVRAAQQEACACHPPAA
jgi:Cd(II)/Pb(II)-responsive transcriptional regulator